MSQCENCMREKECRKRKVLTWRPFVRFCRKYKDLEEVL